MYPRLDNWMLELLEPKERSVADTRRGSTGARSRGFDNPDDNIPSPLSILLSTQSEDHRDNAAAEQPLNQGRLSPSHFHAQLCPILLWPILSRVESFWRKERLSWVRERQSITGPDWSWWVAGAWGAVTRHGGPGQLSLTTRWRLYLVVTWIW